jgi:hypothetical protein
LAARGSSENPGGDRDPRKNGSTIIQEIATRTCLARRLPADLQTPRRIREFSDNSNYKSIFIGISAQAGTKSEISKGTGSASAEDFSSIPREKDAEISTAPGVVALPSQALVGFLSSLPPATP